MFLEVTKTKSVEKALIRMLIERYQRFGVVGRPVNESNVVLNVQYGLQLTQILDLDENKQILRTNCWSMYVSTSVQTSNIFILVFPNFPQTGLILNQCNQQVIVPEKSPQYT